MTAPETRHVFHPDYKNEPYWWETAARPVLPEQPLPAKADIVVVGSGYTGLMAALVAARAGREVIVLDAESAGWGCSTRNGGQVSTSIKPSFAELSARHGAESALAILREGHEALAFLAEFIAAETMECQFERVGRFSGAHNSKAYEHQARALKAQPRQLPTEAHMVPRAEQRAELGSDYYRGGCVFPHHAALDPAAYHLGLLGRARAAGARIHAHCPATGIAREGAGFRVTTPRGTVLARQVAIASNGYTGRLTPWLRRRVIPIGSYMIATEPLEPALMDRLMPKNRVVSDTRKLVYYYRASPDRRRVLFGGRVAFKETDPRVSAPRLHAAMREIFPELAPTRVTHSWMGFVAYTFDTLPHTGSHDGLHYAMGYCGSGVSLASYFGWRLGHKLLGGAEGRTALDDLSYPTRPFYTGNPWFLGAAIAWYRIKDRINL
jgi:glycine/D-amino acid oxidase-like deaminating enzyme